MQTKEWTTVDKSAWGPGDWESEPDKVQFEAHGMPCLLHRGPGGHWCGYVGLTEGHPHFGKSYNDADIDVHGGLTFGDFCADTGDESKGICHIPDEGEPHRVYWLGFDCGHAGDLSPAYGPERQFTRGMFGDTYKGVGYVRAETIKLAEQLSAIR